MKKLKQNKAITLIALVVTIVVLLILAGVSIQLLLDDNGIIAKSKEAKLNTRISEIETEIGMWKQENFMSKEELLELTGDVIEKLPNAMFRVRLENGVEILAHTAGKMRKFRIRVMVGDKVDIEMTPYDLTKGRITFRHKD